MSSFPSKVTVCRSATSLKTNCPSHLSQLQNEHVAEQLFPNTQNTSLWLLLKKINQIILLFHITLSLFSWYGRCSLDKSLSSSISVLKLYRNFHFRGFCNIIFNVPSISAQTNLTEPLSLILSFTLDSSSILPCVRNGLKLTRHLCLSRFFCFFWALYISSLDIGFKFDSTLLFVV